MIVMAGRRPGKSRLRERGGREAAFSTFNDVDLRPGDP
jgi:hypothetical protein